MGINRLSLSAWSQIIDVTEQCNFSWSQVPISCKAYLEVSSATGDFTEGETIQGQTSGATATVFSSYVEGDRVYVENISGNFQTEETIQGQSSGQTATVDKFVEERSYPNNIIKGAFPDSIKSRNIDDYFEFESTRDGSGWPAIIKLSVPQDGTYIVTGTFGVGKRVDALVCSKEVNLKARYFGYSPLFILGPTDYDCLFYSYYGGELGPIQLFPQQGYNNEYVYITFRQQDSGTYRWRIHNIRVLKLLL